MEREEEKGSGPMAGNVFSRYVNSVPPQINNLSADMKDGLILIALMEQLRGSEINRR